MHFQKFRNFKGFFSFLVLFEFGSRVSNLLQMEPSIAFQVKSNSKRFWISKVIFRNIFIRSVLWLDFVLIWNGSLVSGRVKSALFEALDRCRNSAFSKVSFLNFKVFVIRTPIFLFDRLELELRFGLISNGIFTF